MARDRDRFVSLRVEAGSPEAAEIAAAEAWEAGASGVEEGADGLSLTVYAPRAAAPAIARALAAVASEALALRVDAPVEIEDVEWSEAWKEGLAPIVVSERLVVRPSFRSAPLAPGQVDVAIDPGQAFGTGAHASTFLALACMDERLARAPASRVLDVGTGSGVLALCALRLGAARAVGFDLDPLAAPAARAAARANGLDARLDVFTGGVDALGARARGFDLVVANLLRGELLPIAQEVAACVAPGGALVLAGLLDRDAPPVAARFARTTPPLAIASRRERIDADGECWVGLVLERASG
ncbi:MAG: 50S ribosomal protein L11 methyltransferase [Myxococcota bacterium]